MHSPIKAVIVDDEENALENLRGLIVKYCSAIEILDTAKDIQSAADIIAAQQPDVVFLDITLADQNGFDLLPLLMHKPYIVFVTAYEKYALRAIKACALDFLLKPIDINELMAVTEKLHQLKTLSGNINFKTGYDQNLSQLFGALRQKEPVRSLTIAGASGYEVIPTERILYLEGKDNYTFIYVAGSERLVASRTLKDFETILQDTDFFRIHKSRMINLRHLKSLQRKEGLSVVMADGNEFAVSRRRGTSLLERTRKTI